jgi:hypothetical protein
MAMPNARRRGACACPSTAKTLHTRAEKSAKSSLFLRRFDALLRTPASGSHLKLSEHVANLPDS